MVATRAGFRKDTRSGVLWCHALPCDGSAAVTDLSETYFQMRKCEWRPKKNLHCKLVEFSVQMRMETKIQKKRSSPQIDRVFGRIMVSQHKMGSPQNRDTQGKPPPPQQALCCYLLIPIIAFPYPTKG